VTVLAETIPAGTEAVTSIVDAGAPEVGAVLVAAATASVAIGVLYLGVKAGWKAMFGAGAGNKSWTHESSRSFEGRWYGDTYYTSESAYLDAKYGYDDEDI
jgi:hypothetical protein